METVVLLHGIGHTKLNMLFAEAFIKKRGYKTLNITYPSTRLNIDGLSDFVSKRMNQESIWSSATKIHFLTHSMGGLVIRRFLQKYRDQVDHKTLGRVVMIAPPNQGSEIADLLQNVFAYKMLFGPAGQELTTKNTRNIKDDIYYDLGVIAGSRGWCYPLGQLCVPKPHDGRVSIANSKINGMSDHVVIRATHSFISWSSKTLALADYFFKNGKF